MLNRRACWLSVLAVAHSTATCATGASCCVVPAPFEMLDEVLKEARFPLHGEANGSTQRDVALQVLSPSLAGHRTPPGHGIAIVARVSRSSFV